jgi:tetratricopeptide (TPR) repeat protein/DNA-binding XRE family transcriptional regulator
MFPSGSEIKRRRTELKLSQDVLAKSVDISRKYLIDIEKDNAPNVSSDIMARICKALGISFRSADPEVPIGVHISKLRAGYETHEMSTEDCVFLGETMRPSIDASASDPEVTGEYFLLMAQVYNAAKRFSEALRCGLIAAEIFTKSGDRLSWAKAYFEGANTHYERGQFATALEEFLVIVDRLDVEHHETAFMTKVFTSIALCAAAVSDVDLMREYIARCAAGVEFVPEGKRDKYRAVNAYLLGDSLFKSKAYRDAIAEFTKAFVYYSDINDSRAALRMRHNIADSLFQVGEVREASVVAEEIYRLKIEIGESSTVLAESLTLLAEIALSENEHDRATKLCQQVFDLGDGVDSTRKAASLRVIARIQYASGNVPDAVNTMADALDKLNHRAHLPMAIEISKELFQMNGMRIPSVFSL